MNVRLGSGDERAAALLAGFDGEADTSGSTGARGGAGIILLAPIERIVKALLAASSGGGRSPGNVKSKVRFDKVVDY